MDIFGYAVLWCIECKYNCTLLCIYTCFGLRIGFFLAWDAHLVPFLKKKQVNADIYNKYEVLITAVHRYWVNLCTCSEIVSIQKWSHSVFCCFIRLYQSEVSEAWHIFGEIYIGTQTEHMDYDFKHLPFRLYGPVKAASVYGLIALWRGTGVWSRLKEFHTFFPLCHMGKCSRFSWLGHGYSLSSICVILVEVSRFSDFSCHLRGMFISLPHLITTGSHA